MSIPIHYCEHCGEPCEADLCDEHICEFHTFDQEQDKLARACDPRVGDRFVCIDGITRITVIAVDPMEGITDADFGPGHSQIISYTTALTGHRIHQALLCEWETLATIAIKGGHTLHPVEDDEE